MKHIYSLSWDIVFRRRQILWHWNSVDTLKQNSCRPVLQKLSLPCHSYTSESKSRVGCISVWNVDEDTWTSKFNWNHALCGFVHKKTGFGTSDRNAFDLKKLSQLNIPSHYSFNDANHTIRNLNSDVAAERRAFTSVTGYDNIAAGPGVLVRSDQNWKHVCKKRNLWALIWICQNKTTVHLHKCNLWESFRPRNRWSSSLMCKWSSKR